MKYARRLWWGIVIYAILYTTWGAFGVYGFTDGILPRLCELVVLIAICTIAGRALRFNAWTDIIPYSIAWGLEVFLLDAVITSPTYANWNLWIGYALVILLPLAAPQTRAVIEESSPTA